ncbi:MAG: hypothetical protein E3J35_00795 [Methanomassiliicoccales archaeon]|nr:MAG: hypothetical protein E3J35_00795 [Methanomassiliicoccales archaeon]
MTFDTTFAYIVLSTVIISLIAFIGVFTLSMNDKLPRRPHPALVSFSAGGFIYTATTYPVPEIKEVTGVKKSITTLLVFDGSIVLMWFTKIVSGG